MRGGGLEPDGPHENIEEFRASGGKKGHLEAPVVPPGNKLKGGV
jgi:hypothetical protein